MTEQASEAKSTEEQQGERVEPTVVIITGMSGAGRTEAVHAFEDLGSVSYTHLVHREQ